MNDTPHQDFILQNFFPYCLSILANGVSRQLAKTYEERFNLSIAEWRIIAVLGPNGALSPHEIVTITLMDKVAVSRAAAKLIHAGRLSSTKVQNDRRRQVLTLTDKGRGVFEAVVPMALAYEKQLLEALSAHEKEHMRDLVQKLNQWIRTQDIG